MISETIERFSFERLFNKELLPALGFPIIAKLNESFSSLLEKSKYSTQASRTSPTPSPCRAEIGKILSIPNLYHP
ncbi:hypothetical protein [Mycoplasmopsis cynos]|uniref:hypothetical protein n=1 Tax=Mycoplasmopsis cynos TaxID=171284 RepID=UPI003A5C8531